MQQQAVTAPAVGAGRKEDYLGRPQGPWKKYLVAQPGWHTERELNGALAGAGAQALVRHLKSQQA